MKKKVIATLMASVMCMSMLAGCGSENTDAPASSEPASSTPASSEASVASRDAAPGSEAPSAEPVIEQTWPDGQVVTWLVRDTSVAEDGYSRYHHLKTIEILEEELNLDVQFEVIADDDALTARFTAGELPDMMSWNFTHFYSEKGGIPGLANDGIVMDIADYVETKMPNLAQIMEEYPNIARDLATSKGQILHFPRLNSLETPSDIMANTNFGMIIRKDWLDNVGMDVPTNIEEWYNVLTAFKNQDPNGDGEANEIPFDATALGMAMFEPAFATSSSHYIDTETGKVEYGPRTQNYRAYLEEMNKWYMEGLMGNAYDENGALVDYANGSDETIPANLAGSWKGLANAYESWVPKIQEKDPAGDIIACPWPATVDGDVYSTVSMSTQANETTIVTTDCKNVDAALAVLDWMYSEKGSVLMTWGEEGVTYTYDENGNKTLTEEGAKQIELPNGKKPQAYKMYGNQSSYMPSFGNWDVNLATRSDWYKASSKTWAEADNSLVYPKAIVLTPEQAEVVSSDTNAALYEYVTLMKWKFITGQEPLSNYDTYVANLETMGISNIVAVYQEAYDEYMAR